ncbi:MAG: co-chaperone GroES [Candidatus Pacebacteria bacterium CG_4_10_14_0_8_um_filter_43_12]|nr:MAG: co-chaperone GroES [Candidatus Pacebacteria bacterium CG10_big_fil_rev_8_21_14_0_10_44_11]PIY79178.1 MAG: co-chaperone GroES [Candidatus Pacebacteria bacterium CG_4_10_14_0_8_um_filter_43_12]
MSILKVSQLQPLPGYILVEPAKMEKQTASGIYLPDSHDEKPQYGKVIAVGGSTTVEGIEVKSPVKKGDQVIYKKWGGNEFKVGEIEYQFLKFEDVLATISSK